MKTKNEIEQIFRNKYRPMFVLANRILHDEDIARDIVHDVFGSILADDITVVNTSYLLNAVRFNCLKYLRSLSVRDRFIKSYSLDFNEIESDIWPESFRTLNGIYNNTDIFSRFTYRKMTYDVYVGIGNQNYHHAGADKFDSYCLEINGEPQTVNRNEIFAGSATRSNHYPVTFRATYIHRRTQALIFPWSIPSGMVKKYIVEMKSAHKAAHLLL